MTLPININALLNGKPVEWERLEFKEGWNPEAVLHAFCAFANDIHNLDGGYILIGVAEHDGHAVLPIHPAALEVAESAIGNAAIPSAKVGAGETVAGSGTKSGPSRDQVEILRKCLADSLLEMTVPDKPTSSKQRYRTTEKRQGCPRGDGRGRRMIYPDIRVEGAIHSLTPHINAR